MSSFRFYLTPSNEDLVRDWIYVNGGTVSDAVNHLLSSIPTLGRAYLK